MREIKFRAWDKSLGEMHYSIYQLNPATTEVTIWENGEPCVLGCCKPECEMHNLLELMQYTGLKDKNGKEIYEGDILCAPERSSVEHDQSKPNHPRWYGVVSYKVDNENNKCGFNAGELIWKWSACEVIGNIYENPELLG